MDVEDIALSHLEAAYKQLKQQSNICFETPTIHHIEKQLKGNIPCVQSLALKLETLQYTGSFKARGTAYQFISLSPEDVDRKRILVTMSAGNYGKAFAHIAKVFDMPAVVFMPDTALMERQRLIESLGAKVERCPVEKLIENVEQHQSQHGSLFLHSYDDPTLFIGHASAGLELMNQLKQQPDIVVVCCGGGGFLAGVTLALKLGGWSSTKVYGVEPEKAPTMYNAMKAGKIVATKLDSTTIATGLIPPNAGKHALKVSMKYVAGIILVSDEEIQKAVSTLFGIGLVTEPSGAAAFAALQSGKISHVADKNVAVFLTGCNVPIEDFQRFVKTGSR